MKTDHLRSSVASNILQQTATRLFVVVAAVAVDLAADFAAWPSGAVNIHVSRTGTNRREQLIKFSSTDSPLIRKVGNIRRRYGARYLCWWRWAGLSTRRAVAEIGAKEHADGTSHALLSKVDVSLLYSAFKVVISQLPIDSRVVIADTRVECAVTGGRNC